MFDKKILLLYGLPSSGKSTVAKSLTEYIRITVDEIITSMVPNPDITDFQRLGNEIVTQISERLKNSNNSRIVIEMGCLIPQLAIKKFEQFMDDQTYHFTNILLTADDAELERRIIKRNKEIESGKSDSLKIDGPDFLTRFKVIFNNNKPTSFIQIDTTQLPAEDVLDKVRAICN